MIVGCPREIKVREHRVGIIPASALALVNNGHTVLVEKNAGLGSGISDAEYLAVKAQIVDSADEVWRRSDMIVKVKEPMVSEYQLMRTNQIIYTFLHLAAEPKLTAALLEREVCGVGYETIEVNKTLPLLKPSSEVAGKMSIQVGAWCLEKHQGGKGLLLGGVTGVARGNVTILGGGVVGSNAARVAIGMGANVTVIDINLERLAHLDDIFAGQLTTLFSTPHAIAQSVATADLVVGAVLIPGAKAPHLVSKEMLRDMSPGSVIVDTAVDQGGCVETIHATTHDNPTYEVDGIVHYGVSNMPGAVARTSTFALAHATLPYMLQIANLGIIRACQSSAIIRSGINTFRGQVTYEAVAKSGNFKYKALEELL